MNSERFRYRWIYLMFIGAIGIFMGTGCVPADDTTEAPEFRLALTDAQQQQVLDYQDRMLVDSLVPFFSAADPSLRYRAAMAVASLKDTTVINHLNRLLKDDTPEVRYAAAYALGQTGSPQAEDILVNNFQSDDSLGRFRRSNAAILEAVGKTGTVESLRLLSTIGTYQLSDSVLILGQARGIYRFALRGLVTAEGTRTMVDLLATTQLPQPVRVIAANYLFRATQVNASEYLSTLIPMFENDSDPRIRMCLAVAIGRTEDPQALRALQRRFPRETDYRVQCNMLRAMRYYSYARGKDLCYGAIQNKNLHVARIAAQYFIEYGIREDALRYRSIAQSQLPWEVKSRMYHASNEHLPNYYRITKGNINSELSAWLRRSKNPYESAAVIRALGADPRNYATIHQNGFQADHPAVKTAAVETLGGIVTGEDFIRTFSGQAATVRNQIAGYLAEAVQSGDVAMVTVAAQTLGDPQMHGAAQPHLPTLENALAQLALPQDVEAYYALAECIAAIKGDTYRQSPPQYNHPVDWDRVAELSDTVTAEVITSKGTFSIRLLPRQAPATVQNFINLARDRFYHGKNFHRVVPNFVIQGGCPRGDGYGSLDYTIRSELGPAYYDRAGIVGMASAGNHTECTQWFVTHSPAPHLDGNYTIFGRVVDGLDVIHDIQIGDAIEEVNILN